MGNDEIGLSQLDLDSTFKVQPSTVNLITIQSDNQSREQ